MRATLLHNPNAGDEHPSADDLVAILEEAGFQVRYQSTKKDWKKALDKKADVLIAAGGDGTLAKVLTAAAGGDLPVALLPVGTANNIGRTLRLLGDVADLARAWRAAQRGVLDLGQVRWADGEQLFVEGCGGGAFARAIERGEEDVEQSATLLGDETDRALLYLRRLIEDARPQAWQVTVDGRDHSGEYCLVEVLNIRFAGPSVPLAPDADPSDGVLDVVLVGDADRRPILDYLADRIDHKAADVLPLRVVGGRRIQLVPPEGPFRVDDDIIQTGAKAVEIEVRPAAVEILLGRPPASATGR